MKKKKNKHLYLKLFYFICVIIVFVAGLYYENGYTDINVFAEDIKKQATKVCTEISQNFNSKIKDDSNKEQKKEYKVVNGTLEMHIIDVGQRRQYFI